MPRIKAPDEISLILEALRGMHTRSRREQSSMYALAGFLFVSGPIFLISTWRNGFQILNWSDLFVGVFLPISLIVLAFYLYAAGQVRYHIAQEQIDSSAPFGFFTWTIDTSTVTAIDYDRGSYDARYLTFITAQDTKHSIVCITSIQAALKALAERLSTAAS